MPTKTTPDVLTVPTVVLEPPFTPYVPFVSTPEIEQFANLSTQKKVYEVKTNFADKVLDVRVKYSKTIIEGTVVKTQLKKAIDEYIQNLKFIKKLEDTSLITDGDIVNIEHHLYDMEKISQNRINDLLND